MCNLSPDYFEFYVRVDREHISRARHDQPACRPLESKRAIVECPNQHCERSIEIVPVPGADRYMCPHCDADLEYDRDDGGVR